MILCLRPLQSVSQVELKSVGDAGSLEHDRLLIKTAASEQRVRLELQVVIEQVLRVFVPLSLVDEIVLVRIVHVGVHDPWVIETGEKRHFCTVQVPLIPPDLHFLVFRLFLDLSMQVLLLKVQLLGLLNQLLCLRLHLFLQVLVMFVTARCQWIWLGLLAQQALVSIICRRFTDLVHLIVCIVLLVD